MEGNQTETLPKHVAIIMDGNNRWASEKNLPGVAGHKKALKGQESQLNMLSKEVYQHSPYLLLVARTGEDHQKKLTC